MTSEGPSHPKRAAAPKAAHPESATPGDEASRCKEAALRRLEARARSAEELRSHLVSKGFSADAIEATLRDLTRVGLVSDDALASAVARATVAERPAGRALVDHRVRAREVTEDAADRAVRGVTEGRSESDDALTLARAEAPKALRSANGDAHAAARRLTSLLARRGFEEHDATEATLRALRELGADPSE